MKPWHRMASREAVAWKEFEELFPTGSVSDVMKERGQ